MLWKVGAEDGEREDPSSAPEPAVGGAGGPRGGRATPPDGRAVVSPPADCHRIGHSGPGHPADGTPVARGRPV
jgi:hypothetical protein